MNLKFAAYNLFRNKRRTLSTGLALCVGFVGLNLLGAYIYRVKMALDQTSVYSALHGHVKIFKKDSLDQFHLNPKKYLINSETARLITESIYKNISDIDYIGHNLNGSGLLSNGVRSHPVLFYSFEPEVYARSLSQPTLHKWAKDWILPSQIENIEVFKKSSDTMSLTPKIADIMNLKYPLAQNEDLQLAARSIDGDLNAVNLSLGAEHTTGLQFLEDTIVLVPLPKAQELMATDGVESISIYKKNFDSLSKFKQKIDEAINQIDPNLMSVYYYDEKINSLYLGTLGFLTVMGGFFVFLIGTAVSLSIINSLTMGIIERTREIGTLRAVGYRIKDVSKIFILENLILTFISTIFGVILVSIISQLVNNLGITFTPPGASNPILFRLVWNGTIAFTVWILILALVWISSLFVIKAKLNQKLVNLLQDTGA